MSFRMFSYFCQLSTVNRAQLKDACNILATLIPEMLKVMLNHSHDKTWGKPFYPVVKIA